MIKNCFPSSHVCNENNDQYVCMHKNLKHFKITSKFPNSPLSPNEQWLDLYISISFQREKDVVKNS
jgi:hypothetical protein